METTDNLNADMAQQAFVHTHRNDDVRALMLHARRYPEVDVRAAAVQIAAWQTARTKLPLWAATDGILYPEHLSMEQCSSQATAAYKARLVTKADRLTDLTGGFGVDATMLARAAAPSHLTFVERDARLCALARHNLPLLGIDGAEVLNADAEAVLRDLPRQQLIFIDPARRDQHGRKTVAIADCSPNVLALNDLLLTKSDLVMIKLSPMLNLNETERTLHGVSDIHVISVHGECKEVLIVLRSTPSDVVAASAPLIHCVNLEARQPSAGGAPTDSHFAFTREDERHAPCTYATALRRYLYEPNASVLKAAAFKTVAQRWAVEKLHPDSHLYTSDTLHPDFPGRAFEIQAYSTFQKRALRTFLAPLERANLTVRNFPLSVSDLRRRLRLAEGGTDYLFATTMADGQHLLIRTKKI